MKNIKIAFFDIDGTLANDNRIMTNKTIEALNKLSEKGIEIVICSGRSNSYTYKYLKNIKNTRYTISSTGAEIYDHTNKTNIYKNKINFDSIKSIVNYVKNNFYIILNGELFRYTNYYSKESDIIYFKDIEDLKNIDIYQIAIINNNTRKLKETKKYIDTFEDLYISNYSNKEEFKSDYFDIINTGINKGNGVNILLNYLKIDKNNSICFGDSLNDMSMFDSCGTKIAMGNACELLKEKADYIIDTNNNDGIAKFICEYFLK